MFSSLKKNYFYLFIFTSAILFCIGYDYAYPIQANPDEVAQLKNVYAMIQSKSLALQYPSSYSIWTHYIYLMPVVLYWGVFYLFSDLNSIVELKLYIMNNYFQVMPFLRLFTALMFFVSLFYIREVLKNLLNELQANLFFIFVSLNLLVVINAHYAKHWIVDTSLIFFSMYFYYKYNLEREKLKYALFSFFLFSFGTLSSYPLILSGVYFLLIYFYFNKSYKLLIKDILLFLAVFSLMILYTVKMGFGGIVQNATSSLNFSFESLFKLLYCSFDYDPFLFIFFLVSLILLIKDKNIKFLIALIAYLGYLITMSFSHVEPRYALFLVIDAAFLATFFLYHLYNKNKTLFKGLIFVYMAFNLFLAVNWLNIITKKDTRLEVVDWLKQNISKEEKDFVIYNTWGFNYLPLTKNSINEIKNICPNSITTRERLHLKYNLNDGIDGAILWKIDQDKSCDIVDVVKYLKNKSYKVIFINERFGKAAIFDQPSKKSFERVKNRFYLNKIKEFVPYRNDPKEIEKIGDIILNFENPLQTMYYLKQSGPKIDIYEIETKE